MELPSVEVKEIEYFCYIKEHKKFIELAWENLKPKLVDEFWLDDFYYYLMEDRVERHDMSKFSPDEFNGYRQWFYPVDGETRNQYLFDVAWLHHKNFNSHHWNYWILDTKPIEMSFLDILEMLLDWTAMSYKFNDSPMQYWEKEKSGMILHPITTSTIERWIPLFSGRRS